MRLVCRFLRGHALAGTVSLTKRMPKALSLGKANPNFIKPKKTSGRGQRPGGDFLMTLGFWGNNFLGPYDIQVATLTHEIGHNLWRTHSGDPLIRLNVTAIPNYPSVMNYLFQTQLLRNPAGEAVIDLSGQQLPTSTSKVFPTVSGP